jgi:hypothetical protein
MKEEGGNVWDGSERAEGAIEDRKKGCEEMAHLA